MRKHRDVEKKEDLCQLTVFWFFSIHNIYFNIIYMDCQ